jgi:hypothetical protein
VIVVSSVGFHIITGFDLITLMVFDILFTTLKYVLSIGSKLVI